MRLRPNPIAASCRQSVARIRRRLEAILSAEEVVDEFPLPEELRRQVRKTVTRRLNAYIYARFKELGGGH